MDAVDQQFEAIVQRTLTASKKQKQQQQTFEFTETTKSEAASNQSGKANESRAVAPSLLEFHKQSNKKHLVGSFEIWAQGIAAVVGGVYYGWNTSLTVGFGSYFVGQVLMGLAYSVLVCGLCEVVSSTAFSGGSYGMARVVLGFYPGFIMAIAEVFEYCVYTSLSAAFIGDFVVSKLHLHANVTPLIWLAFYISGASIVITGGKVYWRVIASFGIFALFVVCLYLFAALPITDFPRYASLHHNEADPRDMSNWFTGGMVGFMKILPASTAAFGGIESTVLMTDCCKNPKVDMPRGLVAAVYTLYGVIIAMVLVACSCPPGLINGAFAELSYFMNAGFALGGLHFSGNVSEWLLLPSQYGMAFGFIWPGSKLLYTISQSNLFPTLTFSTTNKTLAWLQNDKNGAVVAFSLFGFLICLIGWYAPSVNFANIAILLGFLTYFSDMMAYYKLQTIFAAVQRDYRSPFGIVVAGLACLFFAISIVGLGILDIPSVYFVLGGSVLVSIYYFCYATHRQTFSEMEQKSLLVLHVIVFNQRKQERMRRSRAPPTFWGNLTKQVNESTTMAVRSVASSFAGGVSKHNTVMIEPPVGHPAPQPTFTATSVAPASAVLAPHVAADREPATEVGDGDQCLSVVAVENSRTSFSVLNKRQHPPVRRGSIGLELAQLIPVSSKSFVISGKVNLLDYYANKISEEEEAKNDEEGQQQASVPSPSVRLISL